MNDDSFLFHGMTIHLDAHVYSPAEDTFLLLDALSYKKQSLVLELGTGCGIIALECARHGCNVICSDINPFAASLTYRNIQTNYSHLKGKIQVVCADLFSAFTAKNQFDMILFNPPYLPTQPEDRTGDYWFDQAVCGGSDGLLYITKFLDTVSLFLKEQGVGYCVVSSQSDQQRLHNCLRNNRLHANIVASQHFENESLLIYLLKST